MVIDETQKIKDQRGFSLLQVTVATALSVSLAVGISTVISNLSKAEHGIKASSDFSSLNMLISAILSNSQTCTLAFGQMANPSFSFNSFANGNAQEMTLYNPIQSSAAAPLISASPQTSPFTGSLSITHLQLSNLTPLTYSSIPNTTAYIATLSVTATKLGTNIGNNTLASNFTLDVVINNSGDTISNCVLYSNNSSQASCLAMTGGDPTYFNTASQTCNIEGYICTQQGGAYSATTTPQCDNSKITCKVMGGTYSTQTNPKCTFANTGWPPGHYCIMAGGQANPSSCPAGFSFSILKPFWFNGFTYGYTASGYTGGSSIDFLNSTYFDLDIRPCCK